jgi:hypothetical protein
VLRTVFVFVAILVPAVAVCSDDDSLAPVLYHGSVSVTSQRKAWVELVTGEAKRHRVDEDILPHWIAKGSWESRHPNLYGTFGAENDEQFVESFVSELVHLGLFKQAVETSGDKSDDVHIRLWFAKTEYFHQGTTRYVLYVEMQMEDQGDLSSRRYVADSRNAHSLVKGDQYGRALVKTAAATDLMQKLIPDVEEWLLQNQATRRTGATPTAAAQDH